MKGFINFTFSMHLQAILGQSDERAPQHVGKMVGEIDFKIQINRSCKCCKHGIIYFVFAEVLKYECENKLLVEVS